MPDLLGWFNTIQATSVPAVAALAGAVGAVVAAIITAVLSKLFLGARDRQDRESEWRKHALELTKLDLERKLKTRRPDDRRPVRPSILDFLANYRDLQELGRYHPRDLFIKIARDRITTIDPADPDPPVGKTGDGNDSG